MSRTAAFLVSRVWMSICAFAGFVEIGRVLEPADFGIFVLASSIALLPQTLVGAGFYEWTMSRAPDHEERGTAYWCTAATGLAGCILLLALALLLRMLDFAEVAKLLLPLSFAPLLWGLSAVHEAALIRDRKGGRVTAVLVTAETVGLAVLLVALENGWGTEGLVASRIANAIITYAGFSLMADQMLPGGFELRRAREMAVFSRDIFASRLLGWMDGYAGDLLIAALLSSVGVGLYRMGARLFLAAAVLLQAPGIALIAVAGEALERGEARMARVVGRFVRLHAAMAMPVFAGLMASVHVLVEIVLLPQWAPSATVAALMCLAAPGWILNNANSAVLIARGRSRALLVISAGAAGTGALAILLGAIWGPVGAAAAKATCACAFAIGALVAVRTLKGAEAKRVLLSMAAICAAAAALAVTMRLLLASLEPQSGIVPTMLQLAAAGLAGLAVYAVFLRLLDGRTFRLVTLLLRRNLRPSALALPDPVTAERTG